MCLDLFFKFKHKKYMTFQFPGGGKCPPAAPCGRPLSSPQKILFGKMLMTSLRVICGLGLPQSKILGTPLNWRSPEKLFCRPFFFGEHLGLCPWSLVFASSIPVLGLERARPWKGCPWPWPWVFLMSLVLALASSLVSSTPSLLIMSYLNR